MEYVFGTDNETGLEVLRTKGAEHTSLTGYRQIEQSYPDGSTITDGFRIVRHTGATEDTAGNKYDWYEIDRHYRTIDRTRPIRQDVDAVMVTNSIAFVTMAEAGSIDAVTAGEHLDLFAEWEIGIDYTVGQLRRYGDKLYKCVLQHRSQADWAPDVTANLWTAVSDPAEEWPEWSPPVGAHDCYNTGDKVTYNGRHYVSTMDGNVWAPDVAGWEEA